MSRKKAYCIINKGGYIYFPIKAEWNPYDAARGVQQASYLPCMPNFFGGSVEEGQDIYSTLIEEVWQESQEKIKIDLDMSNQEQRRTFIEACEELKQATFTGRRNTTEYYFYCFHADHCSEKVSIDGFGVEDRLILSTDVTNWSEKYREMSCILKIPVNQLQKNFDNFLGQCKAIGGDYVYDAEGITRHSDWSDEGTQDAFKKFCEKYGV